MVYKIKKILKKGSSKYILLSEKFLKEKGMENDVSCLISTQRHQPLLMRNFKQFIGKQTRIETINGLREGEILDCDQISVSITGYIIDYSLRTGQVWILLGKPGKEKWTPIIPEIMLKPLDQPITEPGAVPGSVPSNNKPGAKK